MEQEALTGNRVGILGNRAEVAEEGAAVVVTGISVHSLSGAAYGNMALRRAAPGAEALGGGIVVGGREASLVGDEREDMGMSQVGAGLLVGPLRSLPSAEAYVGAGAVKG